MKFRIVERKGYHRRPLFYPEYKTGWWSGWKNIYEHRIFHDSIFNHSKIFGKGIDYTYTLSQAEEVITDFMNYLDSARTYIVIHHVETNSAK